MRSVLKAITTVLAADLAATFTGGLFHGLASGDPAFPYLSYTISPGWEPETNSEQTLIEEVLVLFQGFGTDDGALLAAMALLEVAFMQREVELPLESGRLMGTRLGGMSLDEDPDRANDGSVVWMASREIRFVVQREIGEV